MAQEQHRSLSALPPSPPPSPPRTRRRKKPEDPFLKLARTPIPSPSAPSSPQEPLEQRESLITRIIISPLLFISFILSLFLINRRNRLRRTHSNKSVFSYFSPSAWIDPEPYQDPKDTTWQLDPNNASSSGAPSALRPEQAQRKERKGWFFHTMGRKMTKLEIGDAFEMRGRVMVALLLGMLIWVVVLAIVIRWMARFVWGR